MEVRDYKEQRIMIAERPELIKQRKGLIMGLMAYCNELAQLYNELGLGVFTAADLTDTISNGAREIKRRYIAQEKEAANKLGIASLQMEIIQKVEEFRTPFAQRLAEIERAITSDDKRLLQYLTVDNTGNVILTEENETRLEEDAHIYLTDPKEIEKYMLHISITRQLNALFDDGDGLPAYWWQMFPLWQGVFVMPEHGSNYRGMIEQVAKKRGETAEPQQEEQGSTTEPHPKEVRPQQNRKRGGMVVGVTKAPDYTSRGDELSAQRMTGKQA